MKRLREIEVPGQVSLDRKLELTDAEAERLLDHQSRTYPKTWELDDDQTGLPDEPKAEKEPKAKAKANQQ